MDDDLFAGVLKRVLRIYSVESGLNGSIGTGRKPKEYIKWGERSSFSAI